MMWWCLLLYGLRLEARFDGEGALRWVFGVVLCGAAIVFGVVLCGAAIGLSGFVCVVRLVFC